jgi:hypothetical protein
MPTSIGSKKKKRTNEAKNARSTIKAPTKARTSTMTGQHIPGQSLLNPRMSNLTPPPMHARTVASAPVYGSTFVNPGLATNVPVPQLDRSVSSISNTPGEHFNAFRVDEKSSLECYRQTMEHTLKSDVFQKLKFITSDAMMEFSMDPHSLCQYICTKMNMKGIQQGPFWTNIKNTVKRMIEKQRTNATSGCKKSFIGK